MEKITEFRNTLAVPIHKLSIDSLVQEVCLCPEYFEDILIFFIFFLIFSLFLIVRIFYLNQDTQAVI